VATTPRVLAARPNSAFNEVKSTVGINSPEKTHYAEPRMNVKSKTRLRVTADERPEISRAFRDARISVGLSQDGLAQRLGGSQDAISRWERGIDSPPISALLSLVEMLPEKDRAWWRERIGGREKEGTPVDPDLLALVIESVSAAAAKLWVALPARKQAEIVARVYDRWRATGKRDRDIVEELVALARCPSNQRARER
jgi:transcriptional regulator with XRE-family HTH domain